MFASCSYIISYTSSVSTLLLDRILLLDRTLLLARSFYGLSRSRLVRTSDCTSLTRSFCGLSTTQDLYPGYDILASHILLATTVALGMVITYGTLLYCHGVSE